MSNVNYKTFDLVDLSLSLDPTLMRRNPDYVMPGGKLKRASQPRAGLEIAPQRDEERDKGPYMRKGGKYVG